MSLLSAQPTARLRLQHYFDSYNNIRLLPACQHMPMLNMLCSHAADCSAAEGKGRTAVLCLLETM